MSSRFEPCDTPGHVRGTAFQCGPVIKRKSDLSTFAGFKENARPLQRLNKRLKLYRGEDGWFAIGRYGELWEYGKGKLGFTVGSELMINKVVAKGFKPTQRGDAEANFSCPWDEETVESLIKLLRLRTRRTSPLMENPDQGELI